MYSYFPGEFSSNISGHQCCDICAKGCSEPGMSLESDADETCTYPLKVSDQSKKWIKSNLRVNFSNS